MSFSLWTNESSINGPISCYVVNAKADIPSASVDLTINALNPNLYHRYSFANCTTACMPLRLAEAVEAHTAALGEGLFEAYGDPHHPFVDSCTPCRGPSRPEGNRTVMEQRSVVVRRDPHEQWVSVLGHETKLVMGYMAIFPRSSCPCSRAAAAGSVPHLSMQQLTKIAGSLRASRRLLFSKSPCPTDRPLTVVTRLPRRSLVGTHVTLLLNDRLKQLGHEK